MACAAPQPPQRRWTRATGPWLLLGALLLPRVAPAAPHEVRKLGISPETTERLHALLDHPPAETACKFEGVETRWTDLQARWSSGGVLLPPVRVVTRAEAPAGAQRAGPFAVVVPAAIARSCPSVARYVAALVEQAAHEALAVPLGTVEHPLFPITRGLFAALLLVGCLLSCRGLLRLGAMDRRWLLLGIVSWVAALTLRAWLPFSLGNWYAEVLPAVGPAPWMRFGPGSFAVQSLLRDVGLWGPGCLRACQVLVGAAALPLTVGVLAELGVGLLAASATAVLLVLAPFHARLSASASEHVLASTLCLALLLAWMRALRTADRLWFLCAVLLFAAVCLTRVDMAVPAALALGWPLWRDRIEGQGLARGWRVRVGLMALFAAATLALAYHQIAVPSRHPMPEAQAQWASLLYFLPQFWTLSTQPPGWIALSSVLLGLAGVVAMARARPRLLLRVLLTLLGSFVAVGHTFLADELVAARYFLFTIPVFLITSGLGLQALIDLVPGRLHRPAAALALLTLGLWSGLGARDAYAARYAFQDEYTFLRQSLERLPAGCSVYQIPIRSDALARDIDCCLDLHRSPLTLDFPSLQFYDLPDDPTTVLARPGCTAYYESIACGIADDPKDAPVHDRAETAEPYFRQQCAAVRALGRLRLLEQTRTSPRATVNYFHDLRPRAALYRWTR